MSGRRHAESDASIEHMFANDSGAATRPSTSQRGVRDSRPTALRVLGVDPGLTRCGVGIVEGGIGRRPRFVDAGVVRTPADQDHALRLLGIAEGLEEWFERFCPDVVAVERVFTQTHNLSTAAGVTQAAGLAMMLAARRQIPVMLHTPSEVKAAVTGSGRADKAQVGLMVARICGLDRPPEPADAADAVALAITHCWRGDATNRLAEITRANARTSRTGAQEPAPNRLQQAVSQHRSAARRTKNDSSVGRTGTSGSAARTSNNRKDPR